ncbi:hypothetical protein C5167_048122 [Papaver somniferum]|uniref:Uncharacterized protein n=1 Tax=Papaver somniferum TaxID=3469 RepID=A0A4Y7KH12_PAPSO|nr:hypothetical protein C5167_048122 [Papaver somniferum]
MAVRNVPADRTVKEAIVKENNNAKVDVMELDLSSMASVRKIVIVKSLDLPLNILVNNAGVGTSFKALQRQHRAVRPAEEYNIEGRIINVSSDLHKHSYEEGIRFDKLNDESGYNILRAYPQSKLANILHANELARRLKE